jgi:hypothetical protein
MFGRGSSNIWRYLLVLAAFLLLGYIALRWGPAPVRFSTADH